MKEELKIGYYVVKFYNHPRKYIMYFNGIGFEKFKSDKLPDDEIESYRKCSAEYL
jgi:N-acetylglutamate synthase-like GNAT family acetyltransferase